MVDTLLVKATEMVLQGSAQVRVLAAFPKDTLFILQYCSCEFRWPVVGINENHSDPNASLSRCVPITWKKGSSMSAVRATSYSRNRSSALTKSASEVDSISKGSFRDYVRVAGNEVSNTNSMLVILDLLRMTAGCGTHFNRARFAVLLDLFSMTISEVAPRGFIALHSGGIPLLFFQ